MSKVRRALWISLFSSNTSTFLNFLSSLVIARLLTPAEIGVFSVAFVLVSFAQLFRDFGVGSYIVREPDLTPARVRAAFGLLILTAWCVALILAVLSPLAAAFYHTPGIQAVMLVLALNFLISPFGVLALSNLNREMRFGARSVVELSGTVAHMTTAITLAVMGFSYLSLAWASVVGTATGFIVVQRYRPKDWPWLPSLKGIRRIIGFGSRVTAEAFLGQLNISAAELVLGRALGMEAVALMARAQGAVRILQTVVSVSVRRVGYAYFAERLRAGGDLKSPYLTAMVLLSGIAWPFLGLLAVVAAPAIRVLYGPQWDFSAHLLPALCFSAALSVPFWPASVLYTALGRPGVGALIEAISLAIRVIAIISAVPLGLGAVALALVCASFLVGLAHLVAQRRLLRLTLLQFGAAIFPSLLLSALVLAFALLGASMVAAEPGPAALAMQLLVPGIAALLAWIGGVFLLRHPLRGEIVRVISLLSSSPSRR